MTLIVHPSIKVNQHLFAKEAIGCTKETASVVKELGNLRLNQVLRLAKRGLRVFPLQAGSKVPMKDFAWKTLATKDNLQIQAWFFQFPHCNWAVATGSESNVFVLDIDGIEGRLSLSSLSKQAEKLPPTFETETGKPESYHFWFEYPSDGVVIPNSAGALGPGLDVRGRGGYVVVPPSIHPTGKPYTFLDEDDDIYPAPAWLLELITQPSELQKGYHDDAVHRGVNIRIGERNDTLFRDACAMSRRGSKESEVMAWLKEANKRCEEPLSDRELASITHSACGYPSATRAANDPHTITLDPAALYGVAGKFVNTILPHTEANEAALLLHFLAGFGSMIGRHAYYDVEGAKHYTNIFFACVGETAKGRKGTSWNRVLQVLKRVDKDWTKNCIQGGLSSGEGLITAAASAGAIASDTDAAVADRRLFIVQSEFASTLKVMGREGNTLSPVIRDAWDTGSLQIMVKKNPVKFDGAHISIVAHITREELRRYLTLTESGNGFANRFIWVQTARSKCLPEGGSSSEEEMTELANALAPAVDFGRNADLLQRDNDAKELWAKIYPELSEGRPGMFGAVVSRAEAQVLRLSMLYALLDCSAVIRRPHLEAALAVWDYCEQTARWIFGPSFGNSLADTILSVLTRSEGMTRNDIMNHFDRHKSSGKIGEALSMLKKQGYIRVELQRTGGRGAQLWKAIKNEEDSREAPLNSDGN